MAEARRVLEGLRAEILAGTAGAEPAEERVGEALAALERPSLRRVINATGVVLHTNLGRAPLGPVDDPGRATPTSNTTSRPGGAASATRTSRRLLERLLGAPGIAVNNNAAAVFLALNELAAGGEVRRLARRADRDRRRLPHPRHHGALRRRRCARSAPPTAPASTTTAPPSASARACCCASIPAISASTGFTARPALGELAALGRERGIPVYEDLGSGCVADLRAFGIDEPLVSDSLQAGADLVSFSGDKLLGGPQAGILAGKPEIVARLRRNPLFRALRLDKLIYQALETTLRNLLLERWDEIPALAMIRQAADEIRARAEALLARCAGPDARRSCRGIR